MHKLTTEERAFLNERRFAVLATINADGSPQQTAVWYELLGDRIMMNTRVGRLKERNLRRDPRISLCIEDEYRYLTLKGRVEFDDNQETAQADIKALSTRYDGPEVAERKSRETFSKHQRVTMYMTIEKAFSEGF